LRVWGQFGPENKLIEGQGDEYDVICRNADCEELLLSLADDVKLDSEADDDDEKAAAAAASETEDNEKPTTSRSSRSAYVGRGNVQAPRAARKLAGLSDVFPRSDPLL